MHVQLLFDNWTRARVSYIQLKIDRNNLISYRFRGRHSLLTLYREPWTWTSILVSSVVDISWVHVSVSMTQRNNVIQNRSATELHHVTRHQNGPNKKKSFNFIITFTRLARNSYSNMYSVMSGRTAPSQHKIIIIESRKANQDVERERDREREKVNELIAWMRMHLAIKYSHHSREWLLLLKPKQCKHKQNKKNIE